jgi:hypothetical protein
MPSVITRGAFSAKAFGFTGRTAAPVYVEDVFSTYLYTGTGSDQVLTTGIDLSTKGGLVWSKRRSGVSESHFLQDTARGLTARLSTDATTAQTSSGSWPMNALSTTGMTVNGVSYAAGGETYVSWTFRKQPKFFTQLTYTGDGTNNRQIQHDLGSTPGMIIVKRTSGAAAWGVYHKSLTSTYNLYLNLTLAQSQDGLFPTAPNSTNFYVGSVTDTNGAGSTYVAYLFADQAGGFGLTGSDSVVACGSFTADSSGNATISLGWEPQWIMVKTYSTTSGWYMFDTMREISETNSRWLLANTSGTEQTGGGTPYLIPTATGFTAKNSFFNPSSTNIYLAIRRGPMKVPTSGTSVYSVNSLASSGSINFDSQAYYYDLGIIQNRDGSYGATWADRLRGIGAANTSGTVTTNARSLVSSGTAIESTSSNLVQSASGGFTSPSAGGNRVFWLLRRAAGFFDEVCYTGTEVTRTVAHNLGVAPELMIVKSRSSVDQWYCYNATIGNQYILCLNVTSGPIGPTTSTWNSTSPTSSVFSVGAFSPLNEPGKTYVAYLFATCPGVSKVGSYTGTGAAQNINCGFSAGARFILIKRTDSAGDWYVYDSAQGISSGNDPYLLWNSTAAQVTGTNYVDTFASGFALTATAPAGLNANGGSYIFLAIA